MEICNLSFLGFNVFFFFLQFRFHFFMSFLKLLMLGFRVLKMVVQLLNFICIYLVLLSFHLFLLGQLVLVGLAKSINFIYPLFMFVDLMVSESFLACSFSLSFVDVGHILLLKVDDFLVE